MPTETVADQPNATALRDDDRVQTKANATKMSQSQVFFVLTSCCDEFICCNIHYYGTK
jgi:hypothetical protein